MENFSFEIEFNAERELKTQRLFFNKLWRKNLIYATISIACSLVLMLLEFSRKGEIDFSGFRGGFPIFLAFFGIFLYVLYFKSKKLMQSRIEKLYHNYKKHTAYTHFFNEKSFGYSQSPLGDFSADWTMFSTCEEWKDYLIIYHTGKGSSAVIIGKDEVGETDFNRLVLAVKNKVHNLTHEVE